MSIKLDLLLEKITTVDKLLIKSKENDYSDPIDVNQKDWLEKAKFQSVGFLKDNEDLISEVTKDLILNFEKLNESERTRILVELDKTRYLNEYLTLSSMDRGSFKNSLLVLIIQNLGNDSRDSLLELNKILKEAERRKIDYKKIINNLIPFASDLNKHGQGSMRDILKKTLN